MKRKLIQILTWLGVMAGLTLVAMGIWIIGWRGEQSTESLKWLQMLQTCATFLLPPLFCAWLWESDHKPFRWLQMDRGASWQIFAIAIATMVCAIPAINLLADLNSRFLDWLLANSDRSRGIIEWMKAREEEATVLTERFLQADSLGGLLVNIGLMALLPALAEEMSFRGVLQGVMSRQPSAVSRQRSAISHQPSAISLQPSAISHQPSAVSLPPSAVSRQRSEVSHVAIWVTAFIFSAIHVQFYGFVPRMLMGAMFGYVLAWTGSLWVPIVMHFVNNGIAVVSYQISAVSLQPSDVSLQPSDVSRQLSEVSSQMSAVSLQPSETSIADTIGAGDTWWLGLISLAAVCGLLWLIRQLSCNRK